MSVPLEHDYIGLSSDPCSCSMEKSSKLSSESDTNNNVLNLKATELRLGLPGLCQDFEENPCKNSPIKNNVSRAKRGFSDFNFDGCIESKKTEQLLPIIVKEKKKPSVDAKAQVVGWPPIRSFRKNTMTTNMAKYGDTAEGNSGCGGCLYVKVSMDGAPSTPNFQRRSRKCQCTFNGLRGKEGLSESNLKDLLHRDECVLTYEDKDGDWMLEGDVPWEMFVDSCKRLRIMKGSEAIGLVPRSMVKSKNQTRGI